MASTSSGRVKTYEAIIKGENIPQAGIPESFKVLIKELQSLGLDVRVLKDNGNNDLEEVELKENVDYGDLSIHSIIEGDRRYREEQQGFADAGFTQQEWNESGELIDSQVEEDNYDDSDEE